METITNIIDSIVSFNESNRYIDLIVIALVIMGGYFARQYCKEIKLPMPILTLIVGTLFCLIYFLLTIITGGDPDGVKWFISYCVATSFYELILKQVEKLISKYTSK